MKKTAKLTLSIARTVLSLFSLALSVFVLRSVFHWAEWCPNDEIGLIIVLFLGLVGFLLLLAGLYGAAPIFWTALFYAALEEILFHGDYAIQDGINAIIRLKKFFLW